MTDPKQADEQAEDQDLDLDAAVVQDLEAGNSEADQVRAGKFGCTQKSNDPT
jgi:hypothetical protein